jgi:hypothetical protein
MLLFLASVIEQLDLALEHLSKRDVHNARFALMLTDNAVELVLHQIAKDKKGQLKLYRHSGEEYVHQKALDKAVLRNFEDKVKFARLEGKLSSEDSDVVRVMHEYRNELYHSGLAHESILPALSRFYFFTVCGIIGRYNPRSMSWGSQMELPTRAKKYFPGGDDFFPGQISDFGAACGTLAQNCEHDDAALVAILADQLDRVVDEQNTWLDLVAGGVYESQQTSRDEAVVQCQAWPLAFSDDGKAFAAQHNWTGSAFDLVDYLAANYPFKFRNDPIPSWERQAQTLRAKRSGHAALMHYNSFMLETVAFRDSLEEAASVVDAEIDRAIERARGN